MQVTLLCKAIERSHCVLLSLEMTHFQSWNAVSYVAVSQTPRASIWNNVMGKKKVALAEGTSWKSAPCSHCPLYLLPAWWNITLLSVVSFFEETLTSASQKQHETDSPSRVLWSFFLPRKRAVQQGGRTAGAPCSVGREGQPPCAPAAAAREPCWTSA